MRSFCFPGVSLAIAVAPTALLAEPPRFAPWLLDEAVIQRGRDITITGSATPGQTVAVTLGAEARTAVASDDGHWRASFAPLAAATGLELAATAGSERTVVRDIAIGDVFFCSGQSNMQFTLAQSALPDGTRKSKVDASIRLLQIPRARSQVVATDFAKPVRWSPASESGAGFSAVCLLAGREIADAQRVTVGLVEADWGGTPIEGWMPRDALAAAGVDPAKIVMLDEYSADPAKAEATYGDLIESEWRGRPATGGRPRQPRMAWASLHNAMVAPLAETHFAGAIWYQGENNAGMRTSRADYAARLRALIAAWRGEFGVDMPIVVIQIAPFGKLSDRPGEDASSEIREAQRLVAANDPRAALVVTADVGERLDIHPPLKLPVARRAAAALTHLVYGGSADLLGPRAWRAWRQASAVHIAISGTDRGVMAASSGRPGPFTLCDATGVCRFADARLVDGGLQIAVPDQFEPARVRYCWGAAPICNVFDGAERPLGPFELVVEPRL